jgi:hypothetical protein
MKGAKRDRRERPDELLNPNENLGATDSFPIVKRMAATRKLASCSAYEPENIAGGVMFSLLWSAFIGLLIGAVAKLIVPGNDPGGI